MLSPKAQPGTIPLSVAIDRYFEVALYLLVFTGFGTLASTGALSALTILLVGTALLARGYLLAKRRTWLIPERWTTILTLAYVAFYLADYFVISGGFLNATVHLVLFVMVVRLFSARRDRDRYFLSIIAFLMVLASAVLTVDSSFVIAFAAFMLIAVVTFVLMEMRHASAHATIESCTPPGPRAYRHMGVSIAAAAPILAVLVFIGATGIFFALPRVSAGYLSSYAPNEEITTGFSDTVELGRIGQIQQSKAIVMHLQIDGDRGRLASLKWRGVTLSLFDGRVWSNPHGKSLVARMANGNFALRHPAEEEPSFQEAVRPIHYRVVMEPIGSNVFFLAATPRLLEGNYRLVAMDGGDAVFDLDPQHPIGFYAASSVIPLPDPRQLRESSQDYPPDVALNYLQLPPLDARVADLAQRVTASASNNFDRASAVESYLRNNYGYTLQLPRVVPRDAIANFLFQRKQGHCEYFASAMAVMLRTLRIPSRVVNGFRTGAFNDVTGQYVVRASDAHSWVEAYFPGYGWVSFDPTPAGNIEGSSSASRFSLYMDALSTFWREWIVNYDTQHQTALAWQVTGTGRQLATGFKTWGERKYESALAMARRVSNKLAEAPIRWSIFITIALLVLILVANARRIVELVKRQLAAAHPDRSPTIAASIWYERVVRRLSRQGWQKFPAQTPAEFLLSIDDPELREKLIKFTRHYESARFGHSVEDSCRLPELYEEIATSSRR